jgi:hypothetical protein
MNPETYAVLDRLIHRHSDLVATVRVLETKVDLLTTRVQELNTDIGDMLAALTGSRP